MAKKKATKKKATKKKATKKKTAKKKQFELNKAFKTLGGNSEGFLFLAAVIMEAHSLADWSQCSWTRTCEP